jgi:hypothetical protein
MKKSRDRRVSTASVKKRSGGTAIPNFILKEFERAKAEGRLGHGTVRRRMEALEAAKKAPRWLWMPMM